MVTALLSTLITKDKCEENKKTDHVHYASQILKLVLNNWATSVNQLRQQTHKALRDILTDSKRLLGSHFGALSALIALGPKVLKDCVLPLMDRYLNSLEINHEVISNGHSPSFKSRKEEEVNLIFSTFGTAARSALKNCNSVEEYKMMYKHFGDALLYSPLPKMIDQDLPVNEPAGRLKIRPLPYSLVLPNHRIFDSHFLSSSVQAHFECLTNVVVQVEPKIKFSVRSLTPWPEQRLKRKRLAIMTMPMNQNVFPGCIGKRLGRGSLSRSERQKKLSILSCSLDSLIL